MLSAGAASFVPGGAPATHQQQTQQQRPSAKNVDARGRGAVLTAPARSQRDDRGRSGERGGRGGRGRGRRGGRGGGLSQAFEHDSRQGDRPAKQAADPSQQPSAQPQQQHQHQQQHQSRPERHAQAPAAAVSTPQRGGGMRADHLLNFRPYDGGRGGRGAGRRSRSALRRAPYDRNKFLAANFSFVVSDTADTAAASADADLPLDWDDVLQVDMQTTEEVTCPIALGPPVAPQITPCGHVFSFPAIVQHLVTHGGDNFRRTAPCPLCFSQVAARELRLFTARQVEPIKVGDSVQFALLRRPRSSIIPHEVSTMSEVGPPSKLARLSNDGSPPKAGRSAAAAAPTVQGSSPGAQKAAAAAWQRQQDAGTDAASVAAEVQADRFAKFTIVADPAPLWQRAVQELAEHAAQIVAEGGPDAEAEAPYVWIAQELLAARAAGAADRRQRAVLAACPPAAAAAMPSAADAGAAAARAVKQAAQAASASASEATASAAQAAAVAAAFPQLSGGQHSTGAAGSKEHAEAAFSEDEESAPEPAAAELSGAPPKVEAPPNSFSSDGAASALAGTSPSGRGNVTAPAKQFFYQAADGQAAFLAALPARMLAASAGDGGMAEAPPQVTAKVVDLERVTQTVATRRRLGPLSHVPLGGNFTLVDVELAGVVPAAVLEAFSEELGGRAAKRAARAAAEAAAAKREAAAERATAAAAKGPSAAELKAMPRPAASAARRPAGGDDDLAEALAESALLAERQYNSDGADWGEAGSPPPPADGVSFASMARLGFAATGPTLGTSPGQGSPAAAGVWGGVAPRPWGPPAKAPAATGEPPSASSPWAAAATVGGGGSASGSSSAPRPPPSDHPLLRPVTKEDMGERSGAGAKKKSKPVLLFSSAQRRY